MTLQPHLSTKKWELQPARISETHTREDCAIPLRTPRLILKKSQIGLRPILLLEMVTPIELAPAGLNWICTSGRTFHVAI